MAQANSLRALMVWVLLAASLLLVGHASRSTQRVNADSEQPSAREEQRLGSWLDAQLEAIQRRNAQRVAVVQALGRGELTVTQTAAHFRALDGLPAKNRWWHLRHRFPGVSDDELQCWIVIEFASNQLCGTDSSREEAIRKDLTRRFEQELRRGPITLPTPEPIATPSLN